MKNCIRNRIVKFIWNVHRIRIMYQWFSTSWFATIIDPPTFPKSQIPKQIFHHSLWRLFPFSKYIVWLNIFSVIYTNSLQRRRWGSWIWDDKVLRKNMSLRKHLISSCCRGRCQNTKTEIAWRIFEKTLCFFFERSSIVCQPTKRKAFCSKSWGYFHF